MKPLKILHGFALFANFQDAACQDAKRQAQDSDAALPDPSSDIQRRAAIAARLEHENPVAIRKMGADPGAMFMPHYWGFRDDVASSGQSQMVNVSIDQGVMQPAILPIFDDGDADDTATAANKRVVPRLFSSLFSKRAFTCPSGTNSCSNVGRDDACCPNGLTCNVLQGGGGGGDVGCCAGSSCSGQLAGCQDGYTECSSLGGGCCIPGYECVQGGCVAGATQTVVVSPPPRTTTSPSSSSTPPPPPPSTTTTSLSPSSSSSPSPTSTSVSTSSSSTSSPPPSTSTSSTPSIVAPARPTSGTPQTTIPPSSSSTGGACPTGFYQCSAYYNSGACCQVGRDCGLTSCPAASTTQTLLASNGVTVLAPGGITAGAGAGGPGKCPSGWFSCAASAGGDCCPTGFNCGTASCWINATANAAQSANTPKETPSGAARAVSGGPPGLAFVATLAMGISALFWIL